MSEYADKMIDAAKEAYNKDIKDLQEQLSAKDAELMAMVTEMVELKATNQRLEAENEINNGKIRVLAKVVEDLSDSMAYIANHVNLEMFYGRAIDDIEKAREALNQLEKPRE